MQGRILATALVSAVFGVTSLLAQAPPRARIIGTVVDASTGQPVVAAQVRVLPGHEIEQTHADGRFVIDGLAPGAYTLVIDRLGYRTETKEITLAAGQTAELRIEMAVAAIQLGEIVVTGTLTPRKRDEVLSPVSTLSGAELDRRVAQSVSAMLENQPGIALTSLGPAAGRPVIRGLGGDRILMLEDGQRIGDMSSLSSDHAVATDPLTARQIEVVRGPMSLLYGSSALGGVVNVVREEIPTTLPDELHGAFSLQGESVNEGLTAGGSATTRAGPLAVRAEASARRADELSTPIGKLVNTGAETVDLGFGLGLPGEWGHAGVSYRYYTNDYGIPGGFVGGHEHGVDIAMRRHALRLAGELHREGSLIESISLNGSFTDYHHAELEPDEDHVGTEYFQDLASAEIVAKHGERGMLRDGALGVRAQYRDIVTGGSLRTPSTYDFSFAGFAVEEFGGETLRLQAGLRFDWARYVPRDTTSFVTVGGEMIPVRARSFGSLSGSIGVLWTATDVLRFGASLARAYRTPDFNELFSNGPHLAANSYDVGDPTLHQETGLGVDVFVRLSHERVQGEVAAFHNTLNNYIFPSSRGRAELGTEGDRPLFQYTNEDARFTGVEAELEAVLTEILRLDLSGSLVNAKFTSERAPIPVFSGNDTTFIPASMHPPLIPPARGRVGLRIEQPGRFVGAGVRLVAEQGRLGDFETVTPGYALADLTAGLRITRGATLHTITLRVDNVLDTEYRDHMSRTKEFMPGAGRNISLLYRLVF